MNKFITPRGEGKTLTQLGIDICEMVYVYIAKCYDKIYKDDICKFINYENFGMNESQFLELSKIAWSNLISQNILIVADEYDSFYKINPKLK